MHALAAILITAQLAVSFVPVDGADVSAGVLDLGVITYAEHGVKRSRVSRIVRRVGVQVGGTGSATLRARLEGADGRCRVRVDGLELGAMARVIDPAAPAGIAKAHRIEIDVPTDAANGSLFTTIVWEATAN